MSHSSCARGPTSHTDKFFKSSGHQGRQPYMRYGALAAQLYFSRLCSVFFLYHTRSVILIWEESCELVRIYAGILARIGTCLGSFKRTAFTRARVFRRRVTLRVLRRFVTCANKSIKCEIIAASLPCDLCSHFRMESNFRTEDGVSPPTSSIRAFGRWYA